MDGDSWSASSPPVVPLQRPIVPRPIPPRSGSQAFCPVDPWTGTETEPVTSSIGRCTWASLGGCESAALWSLTRPDAEPGG
jgi:hypothetical protein